MAAGLLHLLCAVFLAQLPQFIGAGWLMYAFVGAGLAIIYLLPRLTTAVPSPLIAIIGLTLVSFVVTGLSTVGDMGALPTTLPFFAIPAVPLTLETLRIILPVALTLTLVGIIESLLTASIVDEMTDSTSDKNRESRGQGIANITTGFFGGMAGCAMIGQSVINIRSGGRGRLSSLAAGMFLLLFILVLADWLVLVPMGALVAVMLMVAIGTFDWSSLRTLHTIPRGEALVMVLTVATVVWTHDLALGVFAGVVYSAILFARKVAEVAFMENVLSEDGRVRTYAVTGQLFFATVTGFLDHFDFQEDVDRVVLDLSRSHIWDHSAVAGIDKAILRFRRRGVDVRVVGLDEASSTLMAQLATHDKAGALEASPSH